MLEQTKLTDVRNRGATSATRRAGYRWTGFVGICVQSRSSLTQELLQRKYGLSSILRWIHKLHIPKAAQELLRFRGQEEEFDTLWGGEIPALGEGSREVINENFKELAALLNTVTMQLTELTAQLNFIESLKAT